MLLGGAWREVKLIAGGQKGQSARASLLRGSSTISIRRMQEQSKMPKLEDDRSKSKDGEGAAVMEWQLEPGVVSKLYDVFTVAGLRVDAIEPGRALCSFTVPPRLTRCNNREKGLKCNYVRFRKQGPKYLDDLDLIFGKVHVTGATAAGPGDISSDESDEDVAEVPKPPPKDDVKLADLKKKGKKKRKSSCTVAETKEEKSPFYRMYKNTCLKIESAADRISSVSATSASPTNVVPTIGEAMKLVEECGVEEGTPLMHTATMLIMKPEFREIFSHLKTNKGRLDVLEREHEKEMRR